MFINNLWLRNDGILVGGVDEAGALLSGWLAGQLDP